MTRRLSVCVVDDEPPARRALEWLLARHDDIDLVASCGDADTAVAAVRRHRPDVLFLDVQMPGGDGFAMLEALGRSAPAVVFVTAFETYAVQAFEAQAIDYIVKPFTDERFEIVLARVRTMVGRRTPNAVPRLVIRDGTKTFALPPAGIEWLEAEDYCVRIHAGAHRPLVRRSLHSLLEALRPFGFVRIHRSAAVNLAAVRRYSPLSSGDAEVELVSGRRLRVSRSHRQVLQSGLDALSTPPR